MQHVECRCPLDLDSKMVTLLQSELEEHGLFLAKGADNQLSLHTTLARREGELVCLLRGLTFDSLKMLEQFLSEGGNRVLADRIVRVDGCILDPTGTVGPMFVALVGVGRFARHFLGAKRGGPNVELRVELAGGAGDGLLQLCVKTRNQAGIAAKGMIAVNLGSEFDLSFKADLDEPDAKRFRGALDAYFNEVQSTLPADPEQVEAATARGRRGLRGRRGERGRRRNVGRRGRLGLFRCRRRPRKFPCRLLLRSAAGSAAGQRRFGPLQHHS